MKLLFASLFLTSCLVPVSALCDDLPRGKVIPRVVCADQADQSYALYLPGDYDPSKQWPAIYAFDPIGQGARPAELFQPAAEKYSYILIASNNSRNGPAEISIAAMQAVWKDSHRRFSIDDRRVYASGFSGGALVAMEFGLAVPGRVRGVIPVGAGLPQDLQLTAPPTFPVYGIVGLRDFNYSEMKDLDRRFASWGLPHHLETTEQDHRWPSQEVLMRAIEWMELQAIKSAAPGSNAGLLEALFQARIARARQLQKEGRLVGAFQESESMLGDFKGLYNFSEAEALMSMIRSSSDIPRLLKKEAKREAFREQLDARYQQRLAAVEAHLDDAVFDPAEFQRSVKELEIDAIRDEAKSGKDEDRRIIAERQLQRILIAGYEQAAHFFELNKPARALAALEVAALVQPENPELQFLMACAMAMSRDDRRALKTLAKAADLGFASPERIESEPAFAALRQNPEYAKVLARIRARLKSGIR